VALRLLRDVTWAGVLRLCCAHIGRMGRTGSAHARVVGAPDTADRLRGATTALAESMSTNAFLLDFQEFNLRREHRLGGAREPSSRLAQRVGCVWCFVWSRVEDLKRAERWTQSEVRAHCPPSHCAPGHAVREGREERSLGPNA
jgi:hypothetical protein